MYFDIETWYDPNDNSKNSPGKALMPITSIVLYSTEKKRYFVFSWHPEKTKDFDDPKIIDKGDVTYVFSKTEEEVIWGFLDLLQVSNVDEYIEIMNNLDLKKPEKIDYNVASNLRLGI